jgi:hypothetical protein
LWGSVFEKNSADSEDYQNADDEVDILRDQLELLLAFATRSEDSGKD